MLLIGNDPKKALSNEIILIDGANVLTRRFCWRQSTSSLVMEESTNLFVNFDFMDNSKNLAINGYLKTLELKNNSCIDMD